jgi:hypothetical protein
VLPVVMRVCETGSIVIKGELGHDGT